MANRDSAHQIDLQKVVLLLDNLLDAEEILSFFFLLTDFLEKNTISKLTQLVDNDDSPLIKLDEELSNNVKNDNKRCEIYIECVYLVGRYDILKRLSVDKKYFKDLFKYFGVKNGSYRESHLSPFFVLLYQVAMNVTDSEIPSLKVMIKSRLPEDRFKKKLEKSTTCFDVFDVLIEGNVIAPHQIGDLQSFFSNEKSKLFNKRNMKMLEDFRDLGRETHRLHVKPPEEEIVPKSSAPLKSGQPVIPSVVGDVTAPVFKESQPQYETTLQDDTGATAANFDFSKTPEQCYPMKNNPCGICAIICNDEFADHNLHRRYGSDLDIQLIRETFVYLKFEIEVYRNKKAEDIENVILPNLQARQNSQKHDCFVLFVLSHGHKDLIYGINGCPVLISELRAPFRSDNCPELAGKPKIFFIQACQGDIHQKGTQLNLPADMEVDSDADPNRTGQTHRNSESLLPTEADIVTGLATVQGYVSYRSKSQGSWYIKCLCETLKKYAFTEDLMSMLTIVNRKVSEMSVTQDGAPGWCKQVPQPQTTLRKKLRFAPEYRRSEPMV